MSAYVSTEEIRAAAERTRVADAKPGADITDADLKDLSTDRLRTLLNAGELAHLGMGAPRHPRA